MVNSSQEKAKLDKCHEMFNTNPDCNNWSKAIEAEKKAKYHLLLAKEIAQEAQREYLIAKKTRKMHEKASIKETSPQAQNQVFTELQVTLSKELEAFEEKELGKQMLKEAKQAFKQAKLEREVKEEAFKKSIPKTFPKDFESLALKNFKALSHQSNN